MNKRKIYLIFIIFFSFSSSVIAQHKERKPLIIKMVKLPDSIKTKLALAELQKEQLETTFDSAYLAMYIYNLITPNNYTLKNGIYTYRVMGPHFKRKLFIYYEKNIYIFRSVSINDILQAYLDCLKTINIPTLLQIKYLQAISKYLQEEYETENN